MGRDAWNRTTATIELNTQELDKLLSPVFPKQHVIHAAPAQGGLANTNLRVVISDRATPVLLRIFQRAPEQACKEFKLNQLVANTVPVPRFLHFAETNEITDGPYIVMEWIDAPRLESIVNDVSMDEVNQLGKTLGETAYAIHSFKFADYGFFDRDLNVSNPIDMGLSGMLSYAKECLIEKNGKERLGEQVAEEALKFLSERGNILNDWTGPPCLTHADFGGSNILVHRKDDAWKVAAVLDWEFAFSGTPFMDFGNLLRKSLGESSSFGDQFHQSYSSSGGVLPKSWRKITALTDLTAWFDFVSRPAAGPELIADARSVIMNTITNWNDL